MTDAEIIQWIANKAGAVSAYDGRMYSVGCGCCADSTPMPPEVASRLLELGALDQSELEQL